MARRPLSTDFKAEPTVRLTEKVGSRFVGRYIDTKDITINNKASKLHKFNAVDGDALITVKDGTSYKEASVAEGDVVLLFGSKAIDAAVVQVQVGEVVEFIYNGQKKLKGGNKFNDIAVAILED